MALSWSSMHLLQIYQPNSLWNINMTWGMKKRAGSNDKLSEISYGEIPQRTEIDHQHQSQRPHHSVQHHFSKCLNLF